MHYKLLLLLLCKVIGFISLVSFSADQWSVSSLTRGNIDVPNMKMVGLVENMKRHVFFCLKIMMKALSLHNFHKYQTLWWIKTMLKICNEKPLKWENWGKWSKDRKNEKHTFAIQGILLFSECYFPSTNFQFYIKYAHGSEYMHIKKVFFL